MILYDNVCTPCVRKKQWNALRNYAKKHGLNIERRQVTRNAEWAREAEQYEIELPFIVNGKQAISLNEPLERLEEDN